jgi:hypothetical protein
MSDSPTPPDREAQIAELMAYLEQHRAEYTLVALRKQLLDAGHPHPLVDEALRRLNGGKATFGDYARFYGCFLSLANWLLIGLIFLQVGMLMSWVSATFAIIGVLLVELMIALAARNSPGREGMGRLLLWTVIWSLVLAPIYVLLFGVCFPNMKL